jgi:hypothetical protein
MNTKFASLLLMLLLSWATVGGCPAPVDGTDASDTAADTVAADSGDDSGSDDTTSAGADDATEPSGGGGADDGGTAGDDATSDDTGSSSTDLEGNDVTGDGSGQPTFTGSYVGDWTRVGQESLGGTPGSEEEWTTNETVTFGADGVPIAFIVPGYLQREGGIDFVAEVKHVGDSVTLTASADQMDYTLTVTVSLATYGETTARVVLSLIHHGEGANDALTQDGTGVQVIEYSLQDGQLAYQSTTTYEVAWFHGSIDTGWDVTCQGTLSSQ